MYKVHSLSSTLEILCCIPANYQHKLHSRKLNSTEVQTFPPHSQIVHPCIYTYISNTIVQVGLLGQVPTSNIASKDCAEQLGDFFFDKEVGEVGESGLGAVAWTLWLTHLASGCRFQFCTYVFKIDNDVGVLGMGMEKRGWLEGVWGEDAAWRRFGVADSDFYFCGHVHNYVHN